jgi:hypothetical protein
MHMTPPPASSTSAPRRHHRTDAVLSAAVALKVGDIVTFVDTTPADGLAYADKVSITTRG